MTVYKNDLRNIIFILTEQEKKLRSTWEKTTHLNLFLLPPSLKPTPLSIFNICDSGKAEWHSLVLNF
jgi:hypothetical protein